MSRERDLDRLIAGMAPTLEEPVYVFVSLPADQPLPAGLAPLMLFREAEGTTLIVEREAALAAGLDPAFPCRRITLSVHSALDAVGFLAAVAAALAQAGLPSNAVSAYHHDHLFVPAARAEEAMAILRAFSAGHVAPRRPQP